MLWGCKSFSTCWEAPGAWWNGLILHYSQDLQETLGDYPVFYFTLLFFSSSTGDLSFKQKVCGMGSSHRSQYVPIPQALYHRQISGNSTETPGLCKNWSTSQSFWRNLCCLQREGNYMSPNKSWPDRFIHETSTFNVSKTEWQLVFTILNLNFNFCIKKKRILSYEKLHLHHWEGTRGESGCCDSSSSASEKMLTGWNVGCQNMEIGQPSILSESRFLLVANTRISNFLPFPPQSPWPVMNLSN